MENPSSLEQNLDVLSRLMVELKHTKDLVAIRGKWDMVAWLKNVRVKESQVDEIMKEYNEKTEEFSPNDLDTDELNRKLIDSHTVVKVLIEEGNAGSESIQVHHLSSVDEMNQLKQFSSDNLKKFTDFNKMLGSGGFSDVYEGEFEGEQVAVKVLKENTGMVYETFLTERITMGRFSHKNLVKLRGFCFDDDIKALVYEYMENGSLEKILYKNSKSVEWERLYDIALGIARGLAYLHHDCSEQIIHHDVKAANVLLDKNLCPKIADFGVSNLMRSDVTHITNTRIRGTKYYIAPEINQPPFPITCRCDVYSFGIMMFEILGRRCSIPKDKIWFPHEVSEMMLNKQSETVMEYCGIMEKDREKAMILLMVAMWCAQYTPTIRPSMSHVVEVLEKEISVTTPPYPFHHHNPVGHSMVPSLQGTPEVHPEVSVNEKSLAISSPTTVAVPDAYREEENKEELEEYLSSKELKKYSPMDLELFTSGFSQSNIIGIGGYGKVYKGKFPDGVEVAIKVFKRNYYVDQEVFMTEARTMSKLYHKNIVRTYGYCFDENMRAIVYEYMPCGSLNKILFKKHHGIEWGRLYNIVIEIAKGLSYLHKGHRQHTIHLNIKPSSILLDDNFSPKITNFGSAKSLASDVSGYTITLNRGTAGYMAPEFGFPTSVITSKADVFSFGMTMFEVLGRKRNDIRRGHWFPQQVWEKFETGQIEELIEDCGITSENRQDAKIFTMIALWCVQYEPRRRPSMGTVVNMLEKILPVSRPPYPFQFVSDDDLNMEAESESILKLYEKKCPPGGENLVVIYTTTIERMKRSFKESNEVRTILQSHQIIMIERDVWGKDVDYEDELNDVMGKEQIPPVLFVKGRLIGGAREVKRLELEGTLKLLLYGIPTEE